MDTKVLQFDEAALPPVLVPIDLIIAFRKREVEVHPVAGDSGEAEVVEAMELLTEL